MSDTTQASAHYDANYYEWQQKLGEFGGWANSYKFKNMVHPQDRVLDFGCGGGFLLNRLNCREKIGIEPNPSALDSVRRFGIHHYFNSVDALRDLGEGTVDVIVSNHALEHTLNPLQEVKNLLPLLKVGGTIHFCVPCESIHVGYKRNDVNHHLYTWCPQNLGNLFSEAGFAVKYSRAYIHKWPRFHRQIALLGWPIFNLACRVYGQIDRRSFQVQLMATRPAN